jgi:hypothetical protein
MASWLKNPDCCLQSIKGMPKRRVRVYLFFRASSNSSRDRPAMLLDAVHPSHSGAPNTAFRQENGVARSDQFRSSSLTAYLLAVYASHPPVTR